MGRGRRLLAVDRERETQRGWGSTLPLPPTLPSPIPPGPAFLSVGWGREVPTEHVCSGLVHFSHRLFRSGLSRSPSAEPRPAPPAAIRADTVLSFPLAVSLVLKAAALGSLGPHSFSSLLWVPRMLQRHLSHGPWPHHTLLPCSCLSYS